MKETTQMMKALGDENRFRIFMLVGEKPMCVCELLEILDIAGSTLSAHLKVLKTAGLVDQKKDGRWIEYFLNRADERVARLYEFLKTDLITDTVLLDADREKAAGTTRDACCSVKL